MSSRHDGGGGPSSTANPSTQRRWRRCSTTPTMPSRCGASSGEILFWNRGAERTFGWTAARGHRTGLAQPAADPLPQAARGDRGNAGARRRLGRPPGAHAAATASIITVDSRWALDAVARRARRARDQPGRHGRLAGRGRRARRRERQLRFVTDSAPVLIAHCDLGRTASSSSTSPTRRASACSRAI